MEARKQGALANPDTEIVFRVKESPDGGYSASAVGHSIITQGDDWDELTYMMRDAVLCHFDEGEAPQAIRVHLVQDEVIPL
ncbi:MAG: 2-oxoisovalerate dehydrogenase [Chloroflexota bacterium]|nr:2-oxoisovalerate dehydrogenase [Chloroflexota bacterium]MDE2683210.1 2-oxoisovalerate dehydrogenase [Chloroflexota bacterium]